MKVRKGGITPMEKVFVQHYVATGDATYSAHKAGYAHAQPSGSKLVQNPRVQQHVATAETKRLFEVALPLAVDALIDTLRNAPIGASRNKAAEIVLNRTLGTDTANERKEPFEMNADELAQEIERMRLQQARLHHEASERAKPVLEHEPDPGADASVFD